MVLSSIFNKIAPNTDLSETFFPPATKFHVEDIPDLSGKVVIVTGANAGIGKETAKALLQKNAKVYVACRSKDKADQAIAELKRETGGKVAEFLSLDLGDLNKVKAAANEFMSREKRLDILFNNAGVMVPPTDQLTTQGLDLQFGTNTLAPYFFTKLLMPVLKASKEATGIKPRVVNTSSSAHKIHPKEGVDFDTLVQGEKRDKAVKDLGMAAKWKLYGQSKIGNILVSHILNEEYGDVIVSMALHPGFLRTELQRHMGFQATLVNVFAHPAPMGALTQLFAGTTAPEEEIKGQYLVPWARIGKPDPLSDAPMLRQKVKEWMEEQLSSY